MKTRFLFLLSPAPRCGTNYLFDVLSLCPHFRAPRIDEDHFISNFPLIDSFLESSVSQSSLPDAARASIKSQLGLSISGALLESASCGEDDSSLEGTYLFKTPATRGLSDAFNTFPESCRFLVIVRNGPDVIESTVQSFPWINFAYAFNRWKSGCKDLSEAEAVGSSRLLRVSFEDLLHRPVEIVTTILQWLEMPTESFPFDTIRSLPVRGSSESKNSEGKVSWAPTNRPLTVPPDQRSLSATRGRRPMFRAFGEKWNRLCGYTQVDSYCGSAIRFYAGIVYFLQVLKYRLRPSLRDFAKRDIGSVPPLLP